MSNRTNPSRLKAEIKGQLTFIGSPCSICGATKRYVSTTNCVKCQSYGSRREYLYNWQKARRRKIAEQKLTPIKAVVK